MMKIHERRYTRMLRSSTREAWRPPRSARGVIRSATPGGCLSATATASVVLTATPSHHQPFGEGPPAGGVADRNARAEVGRVPDVGPPDLAEREVAAQCDPVVERRDVGDDL